MSSIHFESKDREPVSVHGGERSWFQDTIFNISMPFITNLQFKSDKWFDALVNSMGEHYLARYKNDRLMFAKYLETSIAVGNVSFYGIDIFNLALNTAMVIGSPPIKLAARISGQCEVHCFVQNGNRQWISNIICQGLRTGIFRRDVGWNNVLDLLDESGDIVLSYNVCDPFWFEDDELPKTWDELFEELKESGGGLELKPDDFDDFGFSAGWNLIDLNNFFHFLAQFDDPKVFIDLPLDQKLVLVRGVIR